MRGFRAFVLAVLTFGLVPIDARASDCYQWPLDGELPAYDGDTIRIVMPGLPTSIAGMLVRVAGIDTPEIRGKCTSEKQQAVAARDFVNAMIYYRQEPVLFCTPSWGRYGGRVVADVWIDGKNLAAVLIERGLGRPYDGKARVGWCGGQ